jgi:hypothetical protein
MRLVRIDPDLSKVRTRDRSIDSIQSLICTTSISMPYFLAHWSTIPASAA